MAMLLKQVMSNSHTSLFLWLLRCAFTYLAIAWITGCSRYPSSLEDCPWQAEFPAPPEVQTIFEGRVVRKQRAQVKTQDKLYRASCTLWKKQRQKHKETDQRWVRRIQRLMKLNILDIHTQHFSEYTLTQIIANQGCPGPSCSHYWLDSYFNGRSRYVLMYRQPLPKIDVKGREFLSSAKQKSTTASPWQPNP